MMLLLISQVFCPIELWEEEDPEAILEGRIWTIDQWKIIEIFEILNKIEMIGRISEIALFSYVGLCFDFVEP